jgi:hypothetical protein
MEQKRRKKLLILFMAVLVRSVRRERVEEKFWNVALPLQKKAELW